MLYLPTKQLFLTGIFKGLLELSVNASATVLPKWHSATMRRTSTDDLGYGKVHRICLLPLNHHVKNGLGQLNGCQAKSAAEIVQFLIQSRQILNTSMFRWIKKILTISVKVVWGFYWIQGTRNHYQWHKPTIFTTAASCGTNNSAVQQRGQGLCCTSTVIAAIPPRCYLYTTLHWRDHTGVCIIVTTFASDSFPNRRCPSASLLLRMFCSQSI